MKQVRGGFRMLKREQLMDELVHDSYKAQLKLPEPTVCPECGASFHNGRWTWQPAGPGAHQHLCPACSRIRDDFPAGYVTLAGEFLKAHHDEIVALARNCETAEKADHPLQRIMAVRDVDQGLLITTTDSHLARRIAEHVQDAYQGDLEFHYNKEDNLLRAGWRR